MTQRARKVAVILGAAALASGAAVGVTAATKPDSSQSATTAGRQFGPGGPGGPGGAGGPGAGRRPDFATLAAKLGVSETKLQQAMRAVGPPTGNPGGMAAALAQQLGLPTAKVESALQALRPNGTNPPTQMR